VKRKLNSYRQQFYQYQQSEQRFCTYHVCPDTDNTKSHSVNLHVDITLHDHRRMTKIVFDIYVFITRPLGYHPPSSQCFDTDLVYYIYLLLKFTVPK